MIRELMRSKSSNVSVDVPKIDQTNSLYGMVVVPKNKRGKNEE